MNDKITLSEAADMLTIGEVGLIEKHFGKHFDGEDITAVEQLSGLIWAMERRKPNSKYSWLDVEALTLMEAGQYFAPDPIEVDEDDSDSGKEGNGSEK